MVLGVYAAQSLDYLPYECVHPEGSQKGQQAFHGRHGLFRAYARKQERILQKIFLTLEGNGSRGQSLRNVDRPIESTSVKAT